MHNKRLSKTPSSINSNSQAAEQNPQLAYRPFGSQIQKASAAPVTQSTKEDVAFAEQKMEAFGLELQAKYGKITPEGQERLTVLQAKMASFSSSQLEHARRYSHNIANIPLRRPDTPIQAKLTIGEPGDKYEQEADETARQVVQRIHQPQSEKLQRESLPDEEDELQMKPLGNIQRESLPDEEEELQMKPMVQRVSDGGMAATQDLEASINQARGGGQPLAKNIREPMEQGFGADFSRVKVHTDTQADQLNRSIQAKAFTTGQDVFFRQGAYEPGSQGGQELIAHELTHVVQQNGGAVQRSLMPLKKGKSHQDALNLVGNWGIRKKGIIQRNLADDISPSYISTGKDQSINDKNQSLIHRGLVETEIVGDKKYVRAYQTVYASVDPGGPWKDIHQEKAENVEDQKIKFLGKGDTWINFGNPLRALHYVRTYYAQAPGKRQEDLKKLPEDNDDKRTKVKEYHGKPVVRSFLVPYEVYLEITGFAISEPQRGELGSHNLNVDKSKAPDQYQIMEKDVSKLAEKSRPGSLISYVLDHLVSDYEKATYHGKVEGIKKLSEKLGLPDVFDKLTIPMEGTNVPDTKKQESHAKELSELFDLSFLMEKKEHNPKYSQLKISKEDYLNLYLKNHERITELTNKYLGIDVLPETKEERDKLRAKLASAANAAIIPKLIEENYYEGTAAMYGKNSNNEPLSDYASKLAFQKVLLEPVIQEKVAKLTNEEIQKLQQEAEERRIEPKQEKSGEEINPEDVFGDMLNIFS